MRLPVMASMRMQYLVSGVPAGAPVAASGCWLVAETGEAAAIIPNAMTSFLYAMSFLLDGNAGNLRNAGDSR
jgi:hypothetical protein